MRITGVIKSSLAAGADFLHCDRSAFSFLIYFFSLIFSSILFNLNFFDILIKTLEIYRIDVVIRAETNRLSLLVELLK